MNKKIIDRIVDSYLDDYIKVAKEQLNTNEDRDWLRDKDFIEIIENDLSDKGFSKQEINEILNNNKSKETSYKIVAYCLCLLMDYTNIKELKECIKEYVKEDYIENDFSEDDLKQVLRYREIIDY